MQPEMPPETTTPSPPQDSSPTPSPKKLSKTALIAIIVGSALLLGAIITGSVFLAKALLADSSSQTASTGTNIADTPILLEGKTVVATCYSFDVPDEYILSPYSKACQSEVRLGGGLSSGVSLTAITVKAQSGKNTLDYFFQSLENSTKQAGTTLTASEKTTVAGIESGYVSYDDGNGINQTVYFVPDTSGKFAYNGKAVTSYLISGPTAGGLLDIVTKSFTIK